MGDIGYNTQYLFVFNKIQKFTTDSSSYLLLSITLEKREPESNRKAGETFFHCPCLNFDCVNRLALQHTYYW